MKISRELALFFEQQIYGTYSGHMAEIPNNPTLYGLLSAHGIHPHDGTLFPEFLRAVADALSETKF